MSTFNDKYNDIMYGTDDYGVPHGTPNDPKGHPAYNMPKTRHEGGTSLGLIPIGPNHDLGDE